MNRPLTIGYSPCPNDTYIFYALVRGKVAVPGVEFRERLEDVETLNRLALDGVLDITKVSYHALGLLRERYALLRSGGALGRGCGPLIVIRPGTPAAGVRKGPVAVPGGLTTANLLLKLYDPGITNTVIMPFDRIMEAVSNGSMAAGLIIHESRFTYPLYHLEKLTDLGEWWEQQSGLPLPLGAIIGKRALGRGLLLGVEDALRESLRYARNHQDEVLDYCRQYSQEMDDQVMRAHIALYVNEFSLDLGAEGLVAIKKLLAESEALRILPPSNTPLLAEEMG